MPARHTTEGSVDDVADMLAVSVACLEYLSADSLTAVRQKVEQIIANARAAD